ncbi:MAG: hypothetical protein IBJ14_16340 [Hydrogenophaga sp.]|nr:hypothetical protein [Hydrogenophaga sp.]
MRALWIALLIALLPLRGWVGDAMAVSMTAAPLAATAAAGQPGPGDDCPHMAMATEATGSGHGEHASGDAPHGGQHDAGHTQAHLLCDVCNGPALGSRVALAEPAAAEHGLLIARAERFASLAPRHLHKPPIS